jgi:sucrose-6-phosphate hydrolase SacC (GH32 family)
MTIPVELSLGWTEEGLRLSARPVRELTTLRTGTHEWRDLTLNAGENPVRDLQGDLFEILVEFKPAAHSAFVLDLRGTALVYDTVRQELTCASVKAPLKASHGKVQLQVFLDRASIEVFGNNGHVAMSVAAIPNAANRSISAMSRGGSTFVQSLVVHELCSAWARN